MNSELDSILLDVAQEVFASLAFLLPIPQQQDAQVDRQTKTVTASVAFRGPFEGILFVRVDEQMLPAMAANMLGLDFDESPTLKQQHDAFKELANVVCGNLLPAIAGPEAVFEVQTPQVLPPDQRVPQSAEKRPAVSMVDLAMDEGRAELALFTNSDVHVTASAGQAPPVD